MAEAAFPIGIDFVPVGNDIVINFSTVLSNYGIQMSLSVFAEFLSEGQKALNDARAEKARALIQPKKDIVIPHGVDIRKGITDGNSQG